VTTAFGQQGHSGGSNENPDRQRPRRSRRPSDCTHGSAALARALQHFGRLDVLVNDAGRIEVGPLASMTRDDFTSAMNTNFWGAFFVIHEALHHLPKGEGRIVNLSSIGGLISVPHLLPYSPGLMRTGSPINASFKGDASAEYAWFSVADSLPLLSMSDARAAGEKKRRAGAASKISQQRGSPRWARAQPPRTTISAEPHHACSFSPASVQVAGAGCAPSPRVTATHLPCHVGLW
jgi:hypothetical protein